MKNIKKKTYKEKIFIEKLNCEVTGVVSFDDKTDLIISPARKLGDGQGLVAGTASSFACLLDRVIRIDSL